VDRIPARQPQSQLPVLGAREASILIEGTCEGDIAPQHDAVGAQHIPAYQRGGHVTGERPSGDQELAVAISHLEREVDDLGLAGFLDQASRRGEVIGVEHVVRVDEIHVPAPGASGAWASARA